MKNNLIRFVGEGISPLNIGAVLLALFISVGAQAQTEPKKVIKMKRIEVINGDTVVNEETMEGNEEDLPADAKRIIEEEIEIVGEPGTEGGKKMIFISKDGHGDENISIKDDKGNETMEIKKDGKVIFIDKDGKKTVIDENNSPEGTEVKKYTHKTPEGKELKVITIKRKVVIEDMATEKGNKKNTFKADEVLVSPNPNNGKFSVTVQGDEKEKTTISITDASGKQLLNKTVKGEKGKLDTAIDLTNEKAGVYIITITQGKKMTQKKVVIE